MQFTYPKKEKLKSKTTIDLLFSEGNSVSKYPLRLVYVENKEENAELIKFGVSVSKKYFKKAVYRNRAKRLLREAYRLNKEAFLEKFGKNSFTMIFYISPEKPKHYKDIEKDFLKLLKK